MGFQVQIEERANSEENNCPSVKQYVAGLLDGACPSWIASSYARIVDEHYLLCKYVSNSGHRDSHAVLGVRDLSVPTKEIERKLHEIVMQAVEADGGNSRHTVEDRTRFAMKAK